MKYNLLAGSLDMALRYLLIELFLRGLIFMGKFKDLNPGEVNFRQHAAYAAAG